MSFLRIAVFSALFGFTQPVAAAPVPEEALCVGSFGVGALSDGRCLPLEGKKRRIAPEDLGAALSDGVVDLKLVSKTAGEGVDLAPLAGAKAVHTLLIDAKGPVDLAPLAGMTGLRRLELKGEAALALGQIGTPMPGLAELTIKAPLQSVDLAALAQMPHLRKLTLRAARLANVDGMAGLARLEQARFHLNETTDFAALSGSKRLKKLEISGSMGQGAVADLSFAAALPELTHLVLAGNEIEDLGPLSGLSGLTYLSLSDNDTLADLTPLAGLTGLVNLHLAETAVADVTALAGLFALRRLDLSHSAVRDISPLDGLALKFLGLKGTGVE
ncbi:MAG: leucine-rich repeat domain-containing protein [Silicimonas sp.]|nr:leucine-rich repeat domain-containing protein [Silicimonas sp.]